MPDDRVSLEKISSEEKTLVTPGYTRMPGYPNTYGDSAYGGYGVEQKRINLAELWRIVYKRKWLIASILLVVVTVVTIDQFRTKSIYVSSTTIDVGKDTEGAAIVGKGGELIIQSNDVD